MRLYTTFRLWALLAVLCFALHPSTGHCFFTASEISDLKNTPLPADRSITIGKLFDTYQYCKGGSGQFRKRIVDKNMLNFEGAIRILAWFFHE